MLDTLARAEARRLLPDYPHFPIAAQKLLALRPEACRWPLGDEEARTFAFCAAPRCGHASYCALHRVLACEGVR